jgi:thioredoxin 1
VGNERHSGSILDGAEQQPDSEKSLKGRKARLLWRVAVVVGLAVLVGVVIAAKARRDRRQGEEPASGTKITFHTQDVIATVNAEKVTVGELEDALASLPAEYRSEFERQKDAFLEELITRKLLLQQARSQKINETDAYRNALREHEAHPGHEEHVLIDVLLRKEVLDKVEVSDADLRAFYEEYKDQLPGQPSFEQAREMIRPSVLQQRQYEALEAYLAALKGKAAITRNAEWIETQKKAAADNPLDRALSSGKPVLADFGQLTCIPCKMMKPILDKLAEEFKGRIDVLILDTRDYAFLARRHRIRVIPTQIFFDESGKESFRHEGFMSREDILTKLQDLGMITK